MTINALMHENTALPTNAISQENIVLDPLQVLRWDIRAFRYLIFKVIMFSHFIEKMFFFLSFPIHSNLNLVL